MTTLHLAGDWWRAGNEADAIAVSQRIGAVKGASDPVVFLGDCAYDNFTAGEAAGFKQDVIDVIPVDEKSRAETVPVVGNHDSPNPAVWDNFWGITGQQYYTATYGQIQVIAVNSHEGQTVGVSPTQLAWLTNALQTPWAGLRIVCMHHMRWSSYTRTSPDTYNNNTALGPVYDLIDQHNVDLVFCAHAHFYERTKKIDRDRNPSAAGFRQIMAGTGGNGHVGSNEVNNSLMDAPNGSGTVVETQVLSDSPGPLNGFVRLSHTNGEATYTLEYLDRDGGIQDSFTDSLNTPPTTTGTQMLNVVHAQIETGDVSQTIPLAAHAGAGRTAFLLYSHRGPDHPGSVTLPDLQGWTKHANDPSTGFVPACSAWSRSIPAGTSDFQMPINDEGSGWALYVLTGADTANIQVDPRRLSGSTAQLGQLGSGDGLRIAAIATNGPGENYVLPGAPWVQQTSKAWYSELNAAYSSGPKPATPGTITLPGPDSVCTLDVFIPGITIPINQTFSALAVTAGSIVGTGLGFDTASTDQNGITAELGDNLTFVETWSVDPDPSGVDVNYRVTLPAGVPNTEGYEMKAQLLDAADNPISDEITVGSIIGGEASAVLSGRLVVNP